MEEQIIDVGAQEVEENNENVAVQPKINQKELKKIIKEYKRYRKSTLAEIRRLDSNIQYDPS
jgi:hypothetical protein